MKFPIEPFTMVVISIGIIVVLIIVIAAYASFTYSNFCNSQGGEYFFRDGWHYCLFPNENESIIKPFECISQECYFVKEEVE